MYRLGNCITKISFGEVYRICYLGSSELLSDDVLIDIVVSDLRVSLSSNRGLEPRLNGISKLSWSEL